MITRKRRKTMNKNTKKTLAVLKPATGLKSSQQWKGRIKLNRTTLGIAMLVFAAVLSACSPSASPSIGPTAISTSVPSIPTSTPVAASAQQQFSKQTLLDPCVLIDSQEASTFTGASYGTGTEGTTSGGGMTCTYGSETTNVFIVEVAQAPDVATAQADKVQFIDDLQAKLQQLASQGLNITELPNFADGATMAQVNLSIGGETISGSAMGFLKGAIFFGFSDEVKGGQAPSSAAVQAEAQTVLGRLP
jgi:hypothetical protein